MQRYGAVLGLRKSKVAKYLKLHAAVWPDVLRMIKKCHIRNYTIFVRKFPNGKYYLFSYLEYVGKDYAADMAKMAADTTTQKWWAECIPCQKPLANRKQGEWWAVMDEAFHLD